MRTDRRRRVTKSVRRRCPALSGCRLQQVFSRAREIFQRASVFSVIYLHRTCGHENLVISGRKAVQGLRALDPNKTDAATRLDDDGGVSHGAHVPRKVAARGLANDGGSTPRAAVAKGYATVGKRLCEDKAVDGANPEGAVVRKLIQANSSCLLC